MHSLLRTLLLTLVFVSVLAVAPASAAGGEPMATTSPAEAPPSSMAALQERIFILEHHLHALEAELMALRQRLANLGAGAAE